MSTANSPAADSPIDEAIKYICANHFHRVLWLPPTAVHDKLRVTYSTTSNFTDESLPVALFCAPMFGSRWDSIFVDHLASTVGLRAICVDRPGMGGSPNVPLNLRVQVWLETVPALLKALHVQHVSIVSHSAGTIYALNTMYSLPEILDPERPYVALLAPWVHNEHSKATLMTLASTLPAGLIGSFDKVIRFMNARVAPVTMWSGDIISSVAQSFKTSPSDSASGEPTAAEKYGMGQEVGEIIEKLQFKWFLAESTQAVNEDALLCLKKSGTGCWGACEDYEEYARLLTKQREQRHSLDTSGAKLTVDVFFSESDIMIGKGGQRYFERIWEQDGVADTIDVNTAVMAGTNHDTVILDLKKGALKTAFERITNASG